MITKLFSNDLDKKKDEHSELARKLVYQGNINEVKRLEIENGIHENSRLIFPEINFDETKREKDIITVKGEQIYTTGSGINLNKKYIAVKYGLPLLKTNNESLLMYKPDYFEFPNDPVYKSLNYERKSITFYITTKYHDETSITDKDLEAITNKRDEVIETLKDLVNKIKFEIIDFNRQLKDYISEEVTKKIEDDKRRDDLRSKL